MVHNAQLTDSPIVGGSFPPWKVIPLKVLIVDDSKTLRERLVEMLSPILGVETAGEAETVREARAAVRELMPDLIVLDLQLPDGSGIEVLRETKQNFPQTQIIVFTNQPDAQYRRRCVALGKEKRRYDI